MKHSRGERTAAAAFEREGAGARTSLASDLLHLVKHNRKWWLLPLAGLLLLLSLVMILSATGAAPFIYTLF